MHTIHVPANALSTKGIPKMSLDKMAIERNITTPSFGAQNFWGGIIKIEDNSKIIAKNMYRVSVLHDFWKVLTSPVR